MKFKDIILTDYFKLFVKREGKVVLGKRYSSLWLLCSVLTATFLAIAFSNASLDYLSYKMNDPFINWVDIPNSYESSDMDGFEQALHLDEYKSKYHYRNHQTDKYWYQSYATADKSGTTHLHQRFFGDISTPLVQAILHESNVIDKCCIVDTLLCNDSFGVIVTEEALVSKLRYKEAPAYIYCKMHTDYDALDYGADVDEEEMALVPVPVLAVVKQLPSSMDLIGTKFFYQQNLEHAFNLCNPTYFSSLIYFVPENVDAKQFSQDAESVMKANTTQSFFPSKKELPRMLGHKAGNFVAMIYDYEDDLTIDDFATNKKINEEILAKYAEKGVERIFDYETSEEPMSDSDNYISIHFEDLDMISEFAAFAKEYFKIDIEMSQINAKENFNEVSIMANILSWTMIVFAIVCIILFIVNLLQSYFQKVKRNLGTFKAFGISNYELIMVYVLIMMATICASIVISLSLTWFIQEFLSLVGIQKDPLFGYLDLWSSKTFWSVVVIVLASVYTVYTVMKNLLKDTPGDLIYDR